MILNITPVLSGLGGDCFAEACLDASFLVEQTKCLL